MLRLAFVTLLIIMLFGATPSYAGCFLFFCPPHHTHHHHIHHYRVYHYHRPHVIVKRIEKTVEKQVIVKTPAPPAPPSQPADAYDWTPISPLK